MSDEPRGTYALALVAAGGFAGANARYAADLILTPLAGTLAVNVLGSLLLGTLTARSGLLGPRATVAVTAGFLSSLTTYSTFAVQTATAPEYAALNVAANYGLAVGAAALGTVLGGRA